jgi:GTP-binding protein
MNAGPENKRRMVVIVGRPNIGKSAIFNRLTRARVSIVHHESGVTRDRVMRDTEWQGERFELVDTGGLVNMDNARAVDEINAGIRQQIDAAIGETAVAIFVVDITTGPTAMDEEVCRLLRRWGGPVFVAANKADSEKQEPGAAEFSRYGWPVFPVAALHDRGFDPLMEDVMKALPPATESPSAQNPLKVAVVGRPNVGKSSFINRLLRSDRVIVSQVAGTTRDSIDIPFIVGQGPQARHYVLTDTAGLRQLRRVDSPVENFSVQRAEESVARSDVVLLIMDAVQGPTAQDKKIAALIQEHKKGCVLVVNKWDMTENTGVTQRQYGPALQKAMPFMTYCPLVFVSAKTGYNIRRGVEMADLVATQIQMNIPTGVLNRTLLDSFERVHPPAIGGKRLKMFYATQTGTAPVRVRLFVNYPTCLTPAYRDFLIRTLREKFGLEGAPICLDFKERPRHHD